MTRRHYFTVNAIAGAILLFSMVARVVHAQQSNERNQWVIQFDHLSGTPQLIQLRPFDLGVAPDPLLALIENDDVLAELGITAAQRAQLDGAIKAHQTALDKFRRGVIVNPSGHQNEELKSQYREDIEAFRHGFNEAILPHQLERLQQLHFRSLVNRLGLAEAVAQELGQVDPRIRVTPATMANWHSKDAQFLGNVQSLYRDFMERLVAEFPFCEDYLQRYRQHADLLTLDILFADLNCPEYIDSDNRSKSEFEDRLGYSKKLLGDETGSWVVQPPENDGIGPASGLFLIASSNQVWNGTHGGLFSDEQIAAIRLVSKDYKRERDKAFKERDRMFEQNINPVEVKAFMRGFQNEMEANCFDKIWNEILFESQRASLLEVMRERDARRAGVLGVLFVSNDERGEALEEAIKERLEAWLDEHGKKLRSRVVEQYNNLLVKQVELLPGSEARLTKERLGEQADFLVPNLTLILGNVPQYYHERIMAPDN